MSQLFISYSHDDNACAERIRVDLEAVGYSVWKDSQEVTVGSPSYVKAIEKGILSSLGTVVLWSKNAAKSEWVESEMLYTKQFKKNLYPILLDKTPFGVLLVARQYLPTNTNCEGVVQELLPVLSAEEIHPDLHEAELLVSDDVIRERRRGLELIEKLLAEEKSPERLLAILEHVAAKDDTVTMQDLARKIMNAYLKKHAPPTREKSPHTFPVICPNGHTYWFDKHDACGSERLIKRERSAQTGKILYDIYLTCPTCGIEMVVPLDCEGYL